MPCFIARHFYFKDKLPFPVSGNAEQDYMNMLMASPLFHQINDIQEMLEKNATNEPGMTDKILGKFPLIVVGNAKDA